MIIPQACFEKLGLESINEQRMSGTYYCEKI